MNNELERTLKEEIFVLSSNKFSFTGETGGNCEQSQVILPAGIQT